MRRVPGKARLIAAVAVFSGMAHMMVAPFVASSQEETVDGIIARMEFDRLRLYSGAGVNLAERLQLARRQVAAMAGAGPSPGSVVSSRWRALGPDRTDSYGWQTSGRVSAIAIHPRNPDIIYIGAAQGGVWRTEDAGASWRPLTDTECSLAMGSINGGMTWQHLGSDVFQRQGSGGTRISRVFIDPSSAGTASYEQRTVEGARASVVRGRSE